MANLFDDANAPETEPATIVAGDQVKWKRTDFGTVSVVKKFETAGRVQ
ncbi:MAG TPA: hypothetical protein QF630_11340 [Alphaproteobacteria bacterium]|nr:hypothetical protein [Alphaproteobacteria bacterium]